MKDQEQPLDLKLMVDEASQFWTVGIGAAIVLMGLIAFGAMGGSDMPHDWTLGRDQSADLRINWYGAAIGGFGVLLMAYGMLMLKYPQPVFRADRDGFRIKWGRKRPWSQFLGIDVVDRRHKGSKVGEVLKVRVRPWLVFHSVSVATFQFSDNGQVMARDILRFKERLEARWALEDAHFDLGASPVVAAREKRSRVSPPKPSLLGWLSEVMDPTAKR